jgi:hypothetical protein
MPIALPVAVPTLATNLVATSMLGVGVPKYASGVITGLTIWVPQIAVKTQDVGSGGSGTNVPLPVTLPTPLLLANLTTGMISQGLMGVMAPLFLLGLAKGLTAGFLQTLVKTQHVGVGSGTGVASFRAPPAFPSIMSGFASVGMVGPAAAKKAQALGIGLDQTFASLFLPVVIVGSASPTATTGVGFGKIQ